jgi:hypothetical protein
MTSPDPSVGIGIETRPTMPVKSSSIIEVPNSSTSLPAVYALGSNSWRPSRSYLPGRGSEPPYEVVGGEVVIVAPGGSSNSESGGDGE